MNSARKAWIYSATMATALFFAHIRAAAGETNTTNASFQFQAQLSQEYTNMAWDAGWASFQVQGDQLQFEVFLDAMFTNYCSASLMTVSRQVTVQMGAGQLVWSSMSGEVWSMNEPHLVTFGMRNFEYHTGSIPLHVTLLRELLVGNGTIQINLPGWAANGGFWEFPPLVTGRLLPVPGGDATNALAGLPRTPRSISARVSKGPLYFPVNYPSIGVDLNSDGQVDFGCSGQMICTMSIPSSCTTMYGISCVSNAQLLVQAGATMVLPLGESIGALPPTNSAWGNPSVSLTDTLSGGSYLPWTGELGRRGEGYLGARLQLADGDHYGWIRVRLPIPGGFVGPVGPGVIVEMGPVVEEWAFEPIPQVPIQAGARPISVGLRWENASQAGIIRAGFTGETGRTYAVQFNPDLGLKNWTNHGALLNLTSPDKTLDLPMPGSRGFYRILEAE
jgi:hypothetical protein